MLCKARKVLARMFSEVRRWLSINITAVGQFAIKLNDEHLSEES